MPADLARALPADAVFIDLLRYDTLESPMSPQRNAKRPSVGRYVAFIMRDRQPVERVELGPVEPINEAINTWLKAISGHHDTEEAARLAERLWRPIAAKLPAEVRTVYLAPDSELSRVPWMAIPGAKPITILLEQFTGGMSIVPHGPFLLAGLTQLRKESGTESILGVGGVTYNDPRRWPELPGTKTEIAQLQQRAGMRPTVLLSGAAATAQALRASLPGARYAHLATHGQFAREQLSDEARAAVEQWRQWTIDDSRKSTIRVAERHPLAFVSLVLANGEPITGLQIIDLPLESMYLVTLSACETGLGELTGGEGVHGLQRAFHLAGCPNVVASLWKVNDAATAALMAKFYHEMWVNKKPPIEALREAQLTIYRHPELIPDLAGERGAPRLKEAVAVKRVEPRGVNRRVSDTKLWAAFVLSGLGK